MKNTNATTTAWCFWEVSNIVLNAEGTIFVNKSRETVSEIEAYLTLEEAEKLQKELVKAIKKYKEIEESVQEYFNQQSPKEIVEENDQLMNIVVDKVSIGICPICDSSLKEWEDCPWPKSKYDSTDRKNWKCTKCDHSCRF